MRNNVNYSKKFDKAESEPISMEETTIESKEDMETEEIIKIFGKVSIDPSKTLNLRDGNSKESDVVKSLHNGDLLEIVEDGEEWSYICTEDGAFGYVMTQYIKKEA